VARSIAARVSLFPFMSVLACTIGALMLLLVAIALGSLDRGEEVIEAYAVAVRREALEGRTLEARRDRIERAEAVWSQVDEALEARGLPAGLSQSSIEREIDRVREREALLARRSQLRAARARVEDERESIETTIEVLKSRRETLPILIDATGLSRHLQPYFVECDVEGVTAYRASDGFSYFVSNADLSTAGAYGRYLRRIRAIPSALLVLLVRPDGVATMKRAERIAREAGVQRVARLPLPGQGELDWSLVQRAEGSGR
jgi:hypothetical protein